MSSALQILIKQASEKADHCAQAMAKTQQKRRQSEEKIAMLNQYRDECQSTQHSAQKIGLTGQQLRNQHAFVDKITEAIDQQNKEIDFLNSTLAYQQQQWQLALLEQRKYEALVQREQHKQRQKENKRDQKMNDEFAARIHRVKATGEHA